MTREDRFLTTGPEATEKAAADIARTLSPGDILMLEGDLAAGKTTFVRGLVRGLGGSPGEVSSPTFVLVQSYECRTASWLHHVDCYRLEDNIDELRAVGLEDLLNDDAAITAIEWPRTSVHRLIAGIARPIIISITRNSDDSRTIEVQRP